MKNKLMYCYTDVMETCRVGKSRAFEIINEAQYQLYKLGFRTINGKVPAKYIKENYR